VSKFKLLFINQSLGIGGAETFNLQLLKYLAKQEVEVKAYITHPVFHARLVESQIAAFKLSVILDIIGNWKGLIKAFLLFPLGLVIYFMIVLANRKTDVILMSGFIEKIIVTPIARLFNIPVVWIEFGPLQTVFSKFLGLPKFLYNLVDKFPKIIIMPSKHTLTMNQPIVGKVIPCAVDIQPISIKAKPKLVVCVSRLEKGKGQDILIKAWREVVKHIPTAKLRIVGEGAELDNLKLEIRNLNLMKSIKLTGYVPNALTELSKSSVVVFPSLWDLEGFGLVAVEAMALSRPVVGFSRGPLGEIVDRSCGILVPPGDVTALAEAIVTLLTRPKLAARLGEQGYKKYQRNFTWQVIGSRFLHELIA